jgi:transposase-like protein
MKCIYCESERVVKNGKNQSGGKLIQRYLCKGCGRRSNERSGTPIANLQTPVETIVLAMKARSEGLGIRATGRVLGVAANSVINWEKHLGAALSNWSPPAPTSGDTTWQVTEREYFNRPVVVVHLFARSRFTVTGKLDFPR